MGLLSKFLKKKPQTKGKRDYFGAKQGRLTMDWFSSDLTADEAWQRSFRTLRNRARDLERNDPLASRYINMLKTNVVGHAGIRLQSTPKQPNGDIDTGAKSRIEDAWRDWGKLGKCTMSGKQSWRDVQEMAISRLAVDGELFVREYFGADNEHGYGIEILPADIVDENVNLNKNGGATKFGVDVNSFDRPQAYHVFTDEITGVGRKTEVIGADRIIHIFMMERPFQTRGITFMASPMSRQRMLDGFEYATVVGARVAAAKMGFITGNEDYVGAGPDAEGYTIGSAEPGEFERLPNGLTVEPFDPDYPPANYREFTSEMKRSMASGYNVSYEAFANDRTNASFSSIRTGSLEDHDVWRCLQSFLIEHLHERVFENWLLWSITTGAVNLPIQKLDKFKSARWQPRGWDWVDPKKEIDAIKAGPNPLLEYANSKGMGLDELIEKMKDTKQRLKDADLEEFITGWNEPLLEPDNEVEDS